MKQIRIEWERFARAMCGTRSVAEIRMKEGTSYEVLDQKWRAFVGFALAAKDRSSWVRQFFIRTSKRLHEERTRAD